MTDTEYYISKKSDTLLGIYPMTFDKLMKCVEDMPNNIFDNINGVMMPAKNSIGFNAFLCKDNLELLYKIYLTDVKPWIKKI